MLGSERAVNRRDRTGRPLFNETWDRIRAYGGQLVDLGYEEAADANLYVRTYTSITFFADFRGTSWVPIWSDRRALFSWRVLDPELGLERRWRMVAIEAARISPVPIRVRGLPAADWVATPLPLAGAVLERSEPEEVPALMTAPPIARLARAIDPRTGEVVGAAEGSPERTVFVCLCGVRVRRCWDTVTQAFTFEHPQPRCLLVRES